MRISTLAFAALVAASIATRAEESPDALMRDGHWKRVRAIAQTRYQTAPQSADANYLMGAVAARWGRQDEAQRYAEKAVQLAPSNAQYRWLLAEVLGQQAQRASVFRQLGLAKRFRSEAEAVLQLDPGHVDAHMALMTFHLRAPGIAGGDKKKAAAEIEAIRKIDPAKGYLAEARMAAEQQERGRLDGLYTKAVEANPKDYEALMSLFNVSVNPERRDMARAEQLARRALAAEPGRIGGYSGLAIVLVLQRRWADLDAHLADAEKAIPDNLAPLFSAAVALTSEGQDFPRAERYFRRYLSMEREAGAPTHAVAQWRLGLLLERDNRKADAVAAMESAVKLDPSFEPAKKDLKRLKG